MSAEKCWCGGETGWRNKDEFSGPPTICLDSEFHQPLATGRPEKITTVYVAGPMSNYPENNYPAFNEAARRLETVGYKVVNPAAYGATGGHYVDLIREDLRLMLDCHAVAVLEGWWESTGARNEVQVAGLLKMPVRPVAEWISYAFANVR